MLSWLKQILFGPEVVYTAEAKTRKFLQEARLEESDSDDYPKRLVFEFQDPIGDGNSIDRINLRTDGTVVYRVSLFVGDTVASVNLKPSESEFDVVAVDSDDHVVEVDEMHIQKNVISGSQARDWE